MSDPKYDEDNVTLGYLNKALGKTTEDIITDTSKNYNIQPSPPYFIGDTWTEGPTGNMYRCIKDRKIGSYNLSDWEKATNFTDDSKANESLGQVQLLINQLDGEIKSFYQQDDPSSLWSTYIEKEKHIGDLWHNTITLANSIYLKDDNYYWKEQYIPEKLFNTNSITKTIYVTKPNNYKINDIWIIPSIINASDIPNNCRTGQMLFASVSNTNFNKENWTLDSKFTIPSFPDMSKEEVKDEIDEKIETIIKPSILQQAKINSTELINTFNKGNFIKDEVTGSAYITDNENLNLAVHVWKFGLNGIGYSSTGINGTYELAITMNGQIVADFITAGTLSADRIKGGTLTLGGNNGVNGLLKLLDSNYQEIIVMDTNGIELKNGTKLIGSNGILSVLQFNVENWENLGFFKNYGFSGNEYKNINLEIYIPSNFTIASAKLKIRHAPYKYINSSGQFQFYGYARNINLYSCSSSKINDFRRAGILGGEYIDQVNMNNYSKIINALGGNGWTPTATSTNENIQETTSIELVNYLRSGINRLMVKSDEPNPAEELYDPGTLPIDVAPLKRTGIVTMFLTITGYAS
ncbi:MAG: hypothetical protein RR290_00705 [Clostridia bacterium]